MSEENGIFVYNEEKLSYKDDKYWEDRIKEYLKYYFKVK